MPYLYYYRDKDAKRINLVLEQGGVRNPIEIKKTANTRIELTRTFPLLDKSSTPRSKGAVICIQPQFTAIGHNNHVVPVWTT